MRVRFEHDCGELLATTPREAGLGPVHDEPQLNSGIFVPSEGLEIKRRLWFETFCSKNVDKSKLNTFLWKNLF